MTTSRRDVLRLAARSAPAALAWAAGCRASTDQKIDSAMEAERRRRAAASAAAMSEDLPLTPHTDGVVIDQRAWSYEGASGRVLETPSFRLFTTLDRSDLLDRLPLFLERSLEQYRGATTGELPMPQKKLVTYAMGTRSQWTGITKSLMGRRAEVYLRIPRGGFAAEGKGVYFDIGPRDTLAVAGHEGWHQYTQAVFNEPLPIWLDEGFATLFEGFRWDREAGPIFLPWANTERFDRLRGVIGSRSVMGLEDLLSARPQDLLETSNSRTLDYYAQIWGLVHFLRDGEDGAHRPALDAIVADAAHGGLYKNVQDATDWQTAWRAQTSRAGSATLRAYLGGQSLDEMDRAYRNFLVRVVRPGSRDRVVAGFSPMT